MATTLTSKGQVTVPKDIRTKLRLKTGDRVEFVVLDDETVKMIPLKRSIRELRGMLPRPKRSLSTEEMDEAIARGAAGKLDWD